MLGFVAGPVRLRPGATVPDIAGSGVVDRDAVSGPEPRIRVRVAITIIDARGGADAGAFVEASLVARDKLARQARKAVLRGRARNSESRRVASAKRLVELVRHDFFQTDVRQAA